MSSQFAVLLLATSVARGQVPFVSSMRDLHVSGDEKASGKLSCHANLYEDNEVKPNITKRACEDGETFCVTAVQNDGVVVFACLGVDEPDHQTAGCAQVEDKWVCLCNTSFCNKPAIVQVSLGRYMDCTDCAADRGNCVDCANPPPSMPPPGGLPKGSADYSAAVDSAVLLLVAAAAVASSRREYCRV